MYPFGSGMPHPNSQPHQNQQQYGQSVPFGAGAGWAMPPPNQPQYPPSYPPQNNSPPQQPPYPGAGGAYPPYPMAGGNPTPYPPYPGNNHYQQPAPYPSMPSQGQSNCPYSPQQDSRPVSQPPYPGAFNYAQHQPPAPSSQPQFHHQQPYHQQFTGHESHSQFQARKEGKPTVVPAPNFDAVKDAHDLRKAMKGFGTDEDTLINIICRRTNEQRQEIQRQYKTNFGKDLIEDIKSETSGNFENLLVGLLHPIVDFYCREICDAMAGIGTDEDVLIETLCTLSNHEIHTIKNAYVRMYGAHLESELKSETSGNFKRLLVSLCTGARDESGMIDPERAQIDARELLKAGELRIGTDESTFNMILCQRNYNQLKLIFQEYEKMTGHTLEKAIKNEFSGDIMEGLLAIYKCVTNKAEYFASRLHKSMAGLGTNDKQLIRVIVTRCEIDMQDIKAAFERLYGKSLRSWVKGDTSGHYKHALYALIGEQRSS